MRLKGKNVHPALFGDIQFANRKNVNSPFKHQASKRPVAYGLLASKDSFFFKVDSVI